MATHVKHYTPTPGYTRVFAPDEGDLNHLTFGMINFAPDQTLTFTPEAGHEAALTILTGSVNASTPEGQRWGGLGGRVSVFDGPTDTLFLPVGCSIELHATNACEIAVSQAKSDYTGEVTLFAAANTFVEQRGKPGWEREVRTYLPSNAKVGRLLLGEVASGPGQWSSFPPHKHDIDNLPAEANLEEIYMFKIDPETGFAFQGLYALDDADSMNLAYAVRTNDVVAIPRGYHPVAVAPGHRSYYYWSQAGIGHELKVHVEDSLRFLEPGFAIKY